MSAYKARLNESHSEFSSSRGNKNKNKNKDDDAEKQTSNPLWTQLSLGAIQRSAVDFPHAAKISDSTGQSIPGTAVLDPESCACHGVPAFTDGAITHLSSKTPPLHVAAHEATHQMQHAGITRDAGFGAEGHAHQVANTIVAGGSARNIVGNKGASVSSGLRPYTKYTEAEQKALGQWDVGSDAKVGDAGRTVTAGNDKKDCYAESTLIDSANKILKGRDSGIELNKGADTVSGMAPDGSGVKTLVKLKDPVDKYWTDCGRASREVQGPTGKDSKTRGVYNDPVSGQRTVTDATSSYDPEAFRNEIYLKGGLGHDLASARVAYLALSADPAKKEAFDKKMGINRYAAPGVGESYTTRRDDALVASLTPADIPRGEGFNYHWGAVIMVAEPDRVTFENFYKGGTYSSKDREWYFDTFGPPTKPGQTFHDVNAGSGSPGDPDYNDYQVGVQGYNNTTMVTRTSPTYGEMDKLSSKELIKRYASAKTEGEKTVINKALSNRWIKIQVNVKDAQEDPDDVYVVAEHSGRSKETGEIELDTGDRNTFWISLSRLVPITGKIMIKVYESDVFADDLISIIGFDSPYSKSSDKRPWDDAVYHTYVEFDR